VALHAMRRFASLASPRADLLVAWLRYETGQSVLRFVDADVDPPPTTPVVGQHKAFVTGRSNGPLTSSTLRTAHDSKPLSGERATNRARGSAFVRVQQDLANVHVYLNRYRDRLPTLRLHA